MSPKRPCYIDVTLKTSTCEDTSATMVEKENLEDRTNILCDRSAI